MGMFDWLPDASSLTPDFSDPNKMAVWGALGNMLAVGGTPKKEYNNLGAGNALAMLAGAGISGGVKGAEEAQKYKSNDMTNQQAGMGLELSKASQPWALEMAKNPMAMTPFGGMPNSGAGGVAEGGGNAAMGGGQQGGMPQMTQADKMIANAYSMQRMSDARKGDYSASSKILTTWAENNPALKGAISLEQAKNSIVDVNGHKMLGSDLLGGSKPNGGAFGSPVAMPSMDGASQIPATAIPPVSATDLALPGTSAGVQLADSAPQQSIDWNNPADVEKAKAEAKTSGESVSELDSSVSTILGRMPSIFGILDEMDKISEKVPYGPYVGAQRDAGNAIKSDGALNYDRFNKLNENLFTQELPAITKGAGGKLDIPIVNAAREASAVPLDAQPAAKKALIKDTRDLMKKAFDNTLNTYKAKTGKEFDLGRAFNSPDEVGQALKMGIITRDQAKKILTTHHSDKFQ